MGNLVSLGGKPSSTGFGFNGPPSVGSFASLKPRDGFEQTVKNNQPETFGLESKHVRFLKTVENNFEGVDKDVLDQLIVVLKMMMELLMKLVLKRYWISWKQITLFKMSLHLLVLRFTF